jgi:hypothetical protein
MFDFGRLIQELNSKMVWRLLRLRRERQLQQTNSDREVDDSDRHGKTKRGNEAGKRAVTSSSPQGEAGAMITSPVRAGERLR